jgi:hypothetical protein
MDRFEFEEIMKSKAKVVLALACPAAYVAQKEFTNGIYFSGLKRIIGVIKKVAATGLACFGASFLLNGLIVQNDNGRVLELQKAKQPGINISATNKSYRCLDSPLIFRGSFFPLEGLVRAISGTYPQIEQTEFSGTILRGGLEFSIEGKIPGYRSAKSIGVKDLTKYATEVTLNPNSYTNFFDKTD